MLQVFRDTPVIKVTETGRLNRHDVRLYKPKTFMAAITLPQAERPLLSSTGSKTNESHPKLEKTALDYAGLTNAASLLRLRVVLLS